MAEKRWAINNYPPLSPGKPGKPEGQETGKSTYDSDCADNAKRSNYHSSFHVLPIPVRRRSAQRLIYHIALWLYGVVISRYKSFRLSRATQFSSQFHQSRIPATDSIERNRVKKKKKKKISRKETRGGIAVFIVRSIARKFDNFTVYSLRNRSFPWKKERRQSKSI